MYTKIHLKEMFCPFIQKLLCLFYRLQMFFFIPDSNLRFIYSRYLISLIFPPSNPVENYCIRIIQCMFDKGLEKLGFIQSSVGGFNVQILNQTKIALLPPFPNPELNGLLLHLIYLRFEFNLRPI